MRGSFCLGDLSLIERFYEVCFVDGDGRGILKLELEWMCESILGWFGVLTIYLICSCVERHAQCARVGGNMTFTLQRIGLRG